MMKVEKWNFKKDGALTEKALRQKMEGRGFSTTTYTYPPGTLFPDHSHATDKMDAVLSGRFKMTMKNKSVILEAGDFLFIPKGEIHSAAVLGDTPVISIDGVFRRRV